MLNRSASSRRRRGSRSAGTSPQSRPSRSATSSPGRRSSITTSPIEDERASFNILTIDMDRFERQEAVSLQMNECIYLMDNINLRKPRSSEEFTPRNNLVPDTSSRNSLIPIDLQTKSPRNSLVPDNYNRVARNSVIPDIGRSPRNSLVPDSYRNTPRQSVAYDSIRTNLAPDYSRSPRSSLVPDMHRHSKNQLLLEDDTVSRSPRHSIISEPCKSPRGSIGQESVYSKRCSPRGSIASEYYDRSQRGSFATSELNKSPRGSIIRGSNQEEVGRSRRSSTALTFQEPNTERKHSGESYSGKSNKTGLIDYNV